MKEFNSKTSAGNDRDGEKRTLLRQLLDECSNFVLLRFDLPQKTSKLRKSISKRHSHRKASKTTSKTGTENF